MIDPLGRKIDHLRMSLTARCNLGCFYCHNEGNGEIDNEMNLADARCILSEAKNAGIDSVKFTGGEPLLRPDVIDIVAYGKKLGFADISLVTNGTLLSELAVLLSCAGLQRVNIGCDSIYPILPKHLKLVEPGIDAALNAGLQVKINTVVIKGRNEEDIPGLLSYCKMRSINLQLIELIGDDDLHLSLTDWDETLGSDCDWSERRTMQHRMRYHFSCMYVETVRPSGDFCRNCTKLRVMADGRLKGCLLQKEETVFAGQESIELAVRKRRKHGYC